MRMTELFGRTLREPPADAEGAGYRALLRAGYFRSLGGARYAYLPRAGPLAGAARFGLTATGRPPPPRAARPAAA